MDRNRIEDLIIASCYKSKKAGLEAVDSLVETDFYVPKNRKLFSVLRRVVESPEGYNGSALRTEMGKALLDPKAVADFMAIELLPFEDFSYFIRSIKESNERDAVSSFAKELVDLSADFDTPVDEIRSKLMNSVDIITPTSMKTGFSMGDVCDEITSEIDNPRDKILTGILQLDLALGGLAKKEFGIVAALPGAGKTSLALSISYSVASSGIPVAYYGFEMSKARLGEKLLCRHKNIPYFIIDKKPPAEMARWKDTINQGLKEISELPIYMHDETTIPNIDKLEDSIRYMVSKYGVEFVVVDYLQLINVPGKTREYDAVTEVSQRLRKICKLYNVFILALSQLSRDWDKGEDRLPKSSDLRSSGQIEQDAAYIIFILRRKYGEEFYQSGMRQRFHLPYSETSLYLTKNRFSGGSDIIMDQITFIKMYDKYVNCTWTDIQPPDKRCPKCNSAQTYYKQGRLFCKSCCLEQACPEPESKGGLVFKTRLATVYGKDKIYEYAFIHDGYQGDSILKNIRTINLSLSDQKPIRKLSIAGSEELPPLEISDQEEAYHGY